MGAFFNSMRQNVDLEEPMTLDAWGNPYVFIPREDLQSEIEIPKALEYPIHVYSPGADGISNSSGNDFDDINSWNQNSLWLYEKQWQEKLDGEAFIPSLVLTPFAFLAILGMLKVLRLGRAPGAPRTTNAPP
jgi:hypothetical protein